MEEDEGTIYIDDIDHFYRYTRMVSFCNMELSLTVNDLDEKMDMLDEVIEESQYLIDSDDLEELMTIKEITYHCKPFLKYDDNNNYYISSDEINNLVYTVSYDMLVKTYKDLDNAGYVELAWDSTHNDFVYIPKKS